MKEQITGIESNYGDASIRIFHFSIHPLPGVLRKPHTHQYYEILFCTEKSLVYRVEDKDILLQKNQFIIIPPNIPHIRVSESGEKFPIEGISFSLTEQKGKTGFYRAFEEALRQRALSPIPLPSELLTRFRAVNRADWSGSLQSYCQLKSLTSAFIFELFGVLDAFSCEEHATGLDRDREDILVLLDNLLNNRALSLQELAKRINYSERHTARLIRKHYHMSLSELRKRQRE